MLKRFLVLMVSQPVSSTLIGHLLLAHSMGKFGTKIHDAKLPSQSHNESFEQELEADSLARVVSVTKETASDQVPI